jgi:hypothetical protein
VSAAAVSAADTVSGAATVSGDATVSAAAIAGVIPPITTIMTATPAASTVPVGAVVPIAATASVGTVAPVTPPVVCALVPVALPRLRAVASVAPTTVGAVAAVALLAFGTGTASRAVGVQRRDRHREAGGALHGLERAEKPGEQKGNCECYARHASVPFCTSYPPGRHRAIHVADKSRILYHGWDRKAICALRAE